MKKKNNKTKHGNASRENILMLHFHSFFQWAGSHFYIVMTADAHTLSTAK